MVSFKTLKFVSSIGGKLKSKPHIKFGEKIPTNDCRFTFGQKTTPQVKDVCNFGNKIPGDRPGMQFRGCFKSTSRFNSPKETQLNITKVCTDFKSATGITLHCPTKWNLAPLDEALMTVVNLKSTGNFPQDIKHIVIGHGTGSSINGTWRFCETGENVFDFINRTIPKGEKVLLGVCEEGATVAGKPGIGSHVVNSFIDPSMPGKIVESGKNEIIGHFLTDVNSIMAKVTYYNRFNSIV